MAQCIHLELSDDVPAPYEWAIVARGGGVIDLFVRKGLSPWRVGTIMGALAVQLAQLRLWRL